MNAFTPFEPIERSTVPPDGKFLSLWRGLIEAPDNRTMASLALHVANRHELTVTHLKGPCRNARFVLARQECMWELCQTGKWSTTQIGRFLGDRDHSTVIHGRDRHQGRLDAARAEGAA